METEGMLRQLRNSNTGNAEKIHCHLPEEIIEGILAILPVKSLLRFKCVSKSWRSLISSKQFIKTHLENSKKDETFAYHRIISSTANSLQDFSVKSLLIEPVTRGINSLMMQNTSKSFSIVGSCNGLICILVDQCGVLLWNPSTRESKELPDICPGIMQLRKDGDLISSHGFGFDESSGDYKIFVAFLLFTLPKRYMRRVYSLKADSWTGDTVFKNESPLDDAFHVAGKFASGNLHWIRRIRELESKWEIVIWDLKSESFGVVGQPSCMDGYYILGLGVLKECLCVFFDYPQTGGFDIWIWNEYGVEDSWSKLLTISCLSFSWKPPLVTSYYHVTPLLVLLKDEVLLRYGSDFYVYNCKDDSVRQLHVVKIGEILHIYKPVVYIESLVSLVVHDDDGDDGDDDDGDDDDHDDDDGDDDDDDGDDDDDDQQGMQA